MNVDDVYLRLVRDAPNAPARLHASAVAKYSAMAASPARNKKVKGRKSEHLLRYNFTKNNKGRWTWCAKVWLPPGVLSPVLDSLPPGALHACWSPRDSLGEYMLYINFECVIHHKTLEKILRKEGLQICYIRGLTMADLKSVWGLWEKLERKPLV